jgi:CHAT domain-containing protein
MKTGDSIEQLQRIQRLQEDNMAQMLKVDELRQRDLLKEAEAVSAALITSLKKQLVLTEELNKSLVTLDFPFGVLMNTLLGHADIVESLGRASEAEPFREEGLAIARSLGPAELAERQRQLAGTIQEKGRFNEALAQLVAAHDLFLRLNDPVSAARCSVDLAQAYEWLRDFDRALEQTSRAWSLLKRAGIEVDHPVLPAASVERMVRQFGVTSILDFAEPGKMDATLASVKSLEANVRVQSVLCDLYQVEARCLITRHHFDEARQLFEKARPMLLAYAHPALDYQFAKIEVEAGQFDRALAILEELEPLFADGVLRRKLGGLLRLKAAALAGLGRNRDALQTAVEARQALEDFDDPDLAWQCAALEAQIRVKLGDHAQALDAYDHAIATLDYLRRAPLGSRLDNLNLSNKLPVYREAARLAAKHRDAHRCCRYIELVKSRQLAASISLPGGSGPSSELSRQFDEITEQISALEFGAPGDVNSHDLVRKRNELLERLRIEDPRWRALTTPAPFDLDLLLAFLQRHDQAALSFFIDGDTLLAVLLNKGGTYCESIQLSDRVHRALANYQTNLGGRQPSTELFDPATLPDLTLDALVPPSLLEAVLKAKTLLLSPHRELHLVPWSMLKFKQRRLCEIMPSAVVPNLSCVPLLELQVSSPRAAFIGVSAPGQSSISAEEECAALADIYRAAGNPSRPPVIDAAATRKSFLELIRDQTSTLLHASCHGEFVPGEPMLAALVLRDAKVDAGGLTRERIGPREIVLSACSVGQRGLVDSGVELIGDEMLGLIGALMEGGSGSIIASIPPTRDIPTLELMKLYHQARSTGIMPLFALQKAQQTMVADGIFPAWQWGGITLFGAS